MSCKISEFLNFPVSHLNYKKFKLCLQYTLNMSKTIRVYFEVLHVVLVRSTSSLFDVYKRSNVFVFEPIEFEEAKKDGKWFEAM